MDIVEAYGRWADSRAAKRNVEYGRHDTFRASSMGTCHKKQLMQMAGLEGRPITDEKRRFFHSRTLLHDDFVRAMRHQGLAVATEFDVSAGLPEGHTGRGDLLMHHEDECGCGMAGKGHLQIQFATALKLLAAGQTVQAEVILRPLREHQFELTDVKTTHPNLVNYSSTLPRAHNCQQVRTYGLGLKVMTGIDAKLSVTYLPMGEGRPMHYPVEPMEDAVLREMNQLDVEQKQYEQAGILPDVMPLQIKDKKEGPHRVLFYVRSWECNYCEYAEFMSLHHGPCCQPLSTQSITGDRIAYLNPDGSHTFVKRWLEKLGRPIPPGADVEAGPRPGKSAEEKAA